MEKMIKFLVQGSGKEPYRCTFWKVDDYDLHSACTCPAGKKGQYCKHRFALLEGDITNVVDYSEEDFKELQEMLKSSDIADFYDEFAKAKTGEKIKKFLNSFKFGYSEKIFDEDICIWDNKFFPYSKEELFTKYGITYKMISLEEFYNLLEYPLISIPNKDENHLFDINGKYYGTYIGKVSASKKTGVLKLTTKTYTKFKVYEECFDFFNSINIKEYNQKMKEIMK